MPRRAKSKGVYGGLVVLFVLLGFILQFKWMERAREKGATDIIPSGFANKLSHWMLQKKGLDPDSGEAGGVKKIPCETCLGSGIHLADGGAEEICPICQGVGFRMIRFMNPADRICPNCAGMGRFADSDTGAVGTCPRCDGRGVIRSPAAPDSAPDGI